MCGGVVYNARNAAHAKRWCVRPEPSEQKTTSIYLPQHRTQPNVLPLDAMDAVRAAVVPLPYSNVCLFFEVPYRVGGTVSLFFSTFVE